MINLVLSKFITLETMKLKHLEKYNYFGHVMKISRDNQKYNLSKKIRLGWAAYAKLQDIFKSDIPINLKGKMFNQYILPVLLYGSETLTLNKATLTDRIENGKIGVDDIIVA